MNNKDSLRTKLSICPSHVVIYENEVRPLNPDNTMWETLESYEMNFTQYSVISSPMATINLYMYYKSIRATIT